MVRCFLSTGLIPLPSGEEQWVLTPGFKLQIGQRDLAGEVARKVCLGNSLDPELKLDARQIHGDVSPARKLGSGRRKTCSRCTDMGRRMQRVANLRVAVDFCVYLDLRLIETGKSEFDRIAIAMRSGAEPIVARSLRHTLCSK